MECSCEFSAGIDEVCETISSTWPTARKKHLCCECRREILPGEKYHREVVKFEGAVSTSKTCADCDSIRKNLVTDFHYTFLRELVSDEIRERFGEIPERCIAALTPAARAWVCAEIESIWEDDDDEE